MKRSFLYLVFLLLGQATVTAQILGMEAAWTNDFSQWNIYSIVDDEEIEGQLRMRWNADWSMWDYRIGEEFGSIKVKWKGNFNQWEVHTGREIITVQTIFNNDPSRWRIRTSDDVFELELNRRDVPWDWRVDDDDLGFYEVYSEWERDPNVWSIQDETNEEVSIHIKMTILFFSVWSSVTW